MSWNFEKKKNVFEGNEDSYFFKIHTTTPQQLTQPNQNLAACPRIVPHVAKSTPLAETLLVKRRAPFLPEDRKASEARSAETCDCATPTPRFLFDKRRSRAMSGEGG
jgi:hypothetical protein